ncbi:MAG: hypothetical protein E7654_08905 [Ruminococcaceae bacterium]|nr:hypothetical protein [Oscillospiraceae bacterium]
MKQSKFFFVRKFLIADLLTLVLYIALYSFWGAFINEIKQPLLANFVLASATGILFGFLLTWCTWVFRGPGEDLVSKMEAPFADGFLPRCRQLIADAKPTLVLLAISALCDMAVMLLALLGIVERLPLNFLYMGLSIQNVWLNVPFLSSIYGFVFVGAWHLFFFWLYQNKWYRNWHSEQ